MCESFPTFNRSEAYYLQCMCALITSKLEETASASFPAAHARVSCLSSLLRALLSNVHANLHPASTRSNAVVTQYISSLYSVMCFFYVVCVAYCSVFECMRA